MASAPLKQSSGSRTVDPPALDPQAYEESAELTRLRDLTAEPPEGMTVIGGEGDIPF